MEPVDYIVTALTIGIAAGLKDTASQAVKDAYLSVKKHLSDRFGINLKSLENKPESDLQREAVTETLVDSGAYQDEEVLEKIHELLEAVSKYDRTEITAKGLTLKKVKAEYIKAKQIIAKGNASGVTLNDVHVTGGIEIENVNATDNSSEEKKT